MNLDDMQPYLGKYDATFEGSHMTTNRACIAAMIERSDLANNSTNKDQIVTFHNSDSNPPRRGERNSFSKGYSYGSSRTFHNTRFNQN